MPRTFPNYCLNYVSSGSGNASCRRQNAFLGAGEYVSIMRCGCGLSARASRLLGGKGPEGGPDETEKLSFSLT